MEDFFNYKNIIIIQYIGETSNMRRLIRNRMNVKLDHYKGEENYV